MSTTSLPDFAAINAAFQALSAAEKRRAIAQDVLERLARAQLVPTPGKWVSIPALANTMRWDETRDLQQFLYAAANATFTFGSFATSAYCSSSSRQRSCSGGNIVPWVFIPRSPSAAAPRARPLRA